MNLFTGIPARDAQRASGDLAPTQTSAVDGRGSIEVGLLSESEILDVIVPILHNETPGHAVELGPGDDAAIVRVVDGRVVVSSDTMSEDRDFRFEWPSGYATTGYEVGAKAGAQNLSDINAMGATATAAVVSLMLPKDLPLAWVEDFARGINDATQTLGSGQCSIVGGDLSSGPIVVATVTVMGDLAGGAAIQRVGARPGDIVAVAGNLGQAAAGLELLETPEPGRLAPASRYSGVADAAARNQVFLAQLSDAEREAVLLFSQPRPPLTLGPEAARAGATAMMDLSDGLVVDARRLAQASGICIDLDQQVVEAFAELLAPVAQRYGSDARSKSVNWVLAGGEDYGLLATFPADATLPHGFCSIGSVASLTPNGQRRSLVTLGGNELDMAGWDHFER